MQTRARVPEQLAHVLHDPSPLCIVVFDVELSLPQFYQFLQQMQLANRQMQNLSK